MKLDFNQLFEQTEIANHNNCDICKASIASENTNGRIKLICSKCEYFMQFEPSISFKGKYFLWSVEHNKEIYYANQSKSKYPTNIRSLFTK